MVLLENLPALIYTALWPMRVDGRFKVAMKGQNFSILFNFTDFPPAVLLRIHDGDFTVENVADPTVFQADAAISGSFASVTRLLEGLGTALKIIIHREIKFKGLRKIMILWKLIALKEIPVIE